LLAYALAEQNCTSAVVAISPSAPAGVRDIQTRVFWAGLHTLSALRLAPPVITPNRRTLKAIVCNALPRPAREAAYRGMVHESGSAFADLGRWPIDESKIRVPLLTVAASRDKLVPAKLVRMTAKKFASIGGDFREYGEHAHWLYDEPGWEKPAADIYEWLRVATLPLDISDQPPRAPHAAADGVRV
jgi:alpha-beta hydrolase superfamily lysophospholipase